MRTLLIIAGLAAAWTINPGSAAAFEQTPAAPAPDVSVPAASKKAPALSAEPKLSPGKAVEDEKHGLKIPGLGSFNLLPKMDFGLELMYGAQSEQFETLEDTTDPNDVSIRGTIKRRF